MLSTLLVLFAINGPTVFKVFLIIVIAALVFFLVDWGIRYVKVSEPFNKILKVILAVIVIVVCINALLLLVDMQFFPMGR